MRIVVNKALMLILLLTILNLCGLALAAGQERANAGRAVASSTIASATASKTDNNNLRLEREKLDFQKKLEKQKLEIEQQKLWAASLSVGVPLLIGVLTLLVQGWLRRKDSRDAFELKAVEIIFSADNPVGTKNRAGALKGMFPERFNENFGNGFAPSQFAGPRYQAKLEVFKAACEKAETPEEVYKIWASIFPGDEWIKPLVNKKPESTSSSPNDIDASFEPNQETHDTTIMKLGSFSGNNQGYSNNF
jgi:hypothetical protein